MFLIFITAWQNDKLCVYKIQRQASIQMKLMLPFYLFRQSFEAFHVAYMHVLYFGYDLGLISCHTIAKQW